MVFVCTMYVVGRVAEKDGRQEENTNQIKMIQSRCLWFMAFRHQVQAKPTNYDSSWHKHIEQIYETKDSHFDSIEM